MNPRAAKSVTFKVSSVTQNTLRSKSRSLIQQKCLPDFSSMWLPALYSVLDRLVEQYDNPTVVDIEFWESFCDKESHRFSGATSSIDGCVNVFSRSDEEAGRICSAFLMTRKCRILPNKEVLF